MYVGLQYVARLTEIQPILSNWHHKRARARSDIVYVRVLRA